MSFIIEFIPKKENVNELVVVVRAQNGYPLGVFDSMIEASNFISEKVSTAMANNSTSAKN